MNGDEREARDIFAERYAVERQPVNEQVERQVIGAVWGANGYTTLDEARALGTILDLRPGRRLLDVGSGRGWPGLFLSQETGCDVVLSDLPVEALRVARRRARSEGLEPRTAAVVASAAEPALRAGSIDAVVHTDVLC